ncbi:MAG: glycoside hydrolase family 25 protein [Acidimicrobiales bacterium]
MRRTACWLVAVVLTMVAAVGATVATAGPAAATAPLRGVDVSNWQGTVDWSAVKASGRLFAFTKATEGVSYVDRTLTYNRQAMAAEGLVLRGLYHFAHPALHSPADEARHFLSTVGPLMQGEVPVLDLEVEGGPGVGAWAAQWLTLVEQATGHTPVLYSNAGYLTATRTQALTRFPLWVATWGRNDGNVPASQPNTDRWDHWTFWQFTSKASVPGVVGAADESLFAGSVADLSALGQLHPAGDRPSADPLGDSLRKALDDLGNSLRTGMPAH